MLASLDLLEEALRANDERAHQIRERIATIREQRRSGRSYREITPAEDRPLIVELVTASLAALDTASAQVRRAKAQELHREGMTMETIADLFGVTRQRVSALLRPKETGE